MGFGYGKTKSIGGHHSAPSSPIFSNKRATAANVTGGNQASAACFQYACPEDLNGSNQFVRRAPPLAMSSSSAHIQSNGFAGVTHGTAHLAAHLAPSPTISPASSLCSSEMNLSQELQNHPLFKPPLVDRSVSSCLKNITHIYQCLYDYLPQKFKCWICACRIYVVIVLRDCCEVYVWICQADALKIISPFRLK